MAPSVVSIDQAAALVREGDSVAIAGNMSMAPMAFVRALARRGTKNLRLITVPTGAINVDLLVGAGAASSVEFAQVAFGEHGLAPNFRRWVEQGRLTTFDHT